MEKNRRFFSSLPVHIVWVLVGVLGMVGVGYGDAYVAHWVQTNIPPAWHFPLLCVTFLGDSSYIFVLSFFTFCVAYILRTYARTPRMGVYAQRLLGPAVFVFGVNAVMGLLAQGLKHSVARARPRLLDVSGAYYFDPFSFQTSLTSFPSGHSVTAFVTATALAFFLPSWRWLLWGLAFLVGLSRVLIGAHYPSDVVAGALLGLAGAYGMRSLCGIYGYIFPTSPQLET